MKPGLGNPPGRGIQVSVGFSGQRPSSRFTSAAAVPAPASSAGGPGLVAGEAVYRAQGGSVGGMLRAPASEAGCELPGDGTTALWDVTWQVWNSRLAEGTLTRFR